MELKEDRGVIRQTWGEYLGQCEVKSTIPKVVDENSINLTPDRFVCPREEAT